MSADTLTDAEARLLTELGDGENDPTGAGYESLRERGLVEFNPYLEGWDLTATGWAALARHESEVSR